MARQVYNLHLDALAYVRSATGCDYSTALRLVQLYGYLEWLASQGGGCQFSQQAFSRATGCSRTTVRQDLKQLQAEGWIAIGGSMAGTRVKVLGLPFREQMEVAVDLRESCGSGWTAGDQGWTAGDQGGGHHVTMGWSAGDQGGGHHVTTFKKDQKEEKKKEGGTPPQAVEALPSAAPLDPSPRQQDEQGQEDPESSWRPKPRAWNADKRETVRQLWNKHRPPNFGALSNGGLDHTRSAVVAQLCYGRGGYTAFVEQLPKVLAHLQRHPFWGDPSKRFSWDAFFGTRANPKAHWAQLVDEVSAADLACQGGNPDRFPVKFVALGEQWLPMAQNLSTEEFIRGAIDLVKAGKAPRDALRHIEPWTPEHPYNAILDD